MSIFLILLLYFLYMAIGLFIAEVTGITEPFDEDSFLDCVIVGAIITVWPIMIPLILLIEW